MYGALVLRQSVSTLQPCRQLPAQYSPPGQGAVLEQGSVQYPPGQARQSPPPPALASGVQAESDEQAEPMAPEPGVEQVSVLYPHTWLLEEQFTHAAPLAPQVIVAESTQVPFEQHW